MRAWLVSLLILVAGISACGSSDELTSNLTSKIGSDSDSALTLPHEIGTETGNVATRIILAITALYNDVEIQGNQLNIRAGRLGCKARLDTDAKPLGSQVFTQLWLAADEPSDNQILIEREGLTLETDIIALLIPDLSRVFCRTAVTLNGATLDEAQTRAITLNYQNIFLSPVEFSGPGTDLQ